MVFGACAVRCPVNHDVCHRETEAKCPTMNSDGKSACTLGETSIPVVRGTDFIVYELKTTPVDGMVKITLSYTQREMMKLIASRGGELDFDYGKVDEKVRDILKGHISDMSKMGILEEAPIMGHRELVNYHLTTMGRNLVSAMVKQGV